MTRYRNIKCAVAFTGALFMSVGVHAQDLTIKYAHPTSNNSLGGKMATAFKERLEAASGGSMQVQIFPDGQLGKLSEMNELTASGAIQMAHNTWGSLGVFLEEAGALDSPYIFENPAQRQELLTHPGSEIVDVLNEGLVAGSTGLHILAPNGSSARHVTCNRPVFSPADLEGVKFRAIPFPVFIATVKGMGAIPVPIEYSELTTALATGLADCQENPLSNIFNDKLYENQTHIMLTNHIISGGPTLMNAEYFNGLTEEQQGWVTDAAVGAAADALALAQDDDIELTKKLKDLGKVFITAEDGLQVDVFAERVSAEMKQEFGEKYDRILGMIETEKAALLN